MCSSHQASWLTSHCLLSLFMVELSGILVFRLVRGCADFIGIYGY